MAKIAVLEMEVDVQMAIDSLIDRDRKELVSENLSVCDVDNLINEVFQRCDISEVMEYFSQRDIEYWLDNHAEEYGYTKNGGLKQ